MPPSVGASSLSDPAKNIQPLAMLGGAVEPNFTLPPAGWFGMIVLAESATMKTGDWPPAATTSR